MYPNLRAEIARRGLTLAQVAEIIGKTISTTSLKMSGKSDFTLPECKALSVYLGTPIDRLFEVRNGTELR